MRPAHTKQRPSYIVLCASLAFVSVVFGVRVKYVPGVYYALAAIQLTVLCVAAWNLGAWAIRAETEERRRLAVAGALLVTPWALFSFLPGIGPPGDQTHAENALRYLILLINSIATAGGLVVLREALSEAGERFYSALGFAAIMLAAPLYLIWAGLALEYFRAAEHVSAAEVRPAVASLADLMDIQAICAGWAWTLSER